MTDEQIYEELGPMCKNGVLLSKENTLKELRNMPNEDRASLEQDIRDLDKMAEAEDELAEDEREMEGKSNDWICDMCGAENDDADSMCYGCMAERI